MFTAAGAALARQARREWLGSPPHRMTLKGVASHGLAAEPRDLRPTDPEIGAAVLGGDFTYAGQTLSLGKGGHPWDQASPNRRFAVALHRFEWLPHLLTQERGGAAEALRLVLEWRRLFGKWNDFSWDVEVLERRLFNPACGIGELSRAAGAEEAERLRQMIDAGGYDIFVEVDGGVTPETGPKCLAAGADALVAGTAVFKGGPSAYEANIRALRAG